MPMVRVSNGGTTAYRTFRLTKNTDFQVTVKVGDAIAIACPGNDGNIRVDNVIPLSQQSSLEGIGFATYLVDNGCIGLIASRDATHVVRCNSSADTRIPICTCPE